MGGCGRGVHACQVHPVSRCLGQVHLRAASSGAARLVVILHADLGQVAATEPRAVPAPHRQHEAMSCRLFDHICANYRIDLTAEEQARVKDLMLGEMKHTAKVGGACGAWRGRVGTLLPWSARWLAVPEPNADASCSSSQHVHC